MRRAILWVAVIACLAVVGWAYRRDAEVEQGEKAFRRAGCGACHLSGGAPNLQNVSKRYENKRLMEFIVDPDEVYRERGMQPLNPGYPRMPRPGVSETEAAAIVAYLDTLKD